MVVPRRLLCLISSMLLPGARRPGLDGRWVWAPPPGRDLLDQASSYTRNPRSDSGTAGVSPTTLTIIAARAPLRQERVRTRASPLMLFFPGRGSLFLNQPANSGLVEECQSADGLLPESADIRVWRSSRPRARASSGVQVVSSSPSCCPHTSYSRP